MIYERGDRELEIPYVQRSEIDMYIAQHLVDPTTGDYTMAFEDYLAALTCSNFSHRDAAICYRAGWEVDLTDAALKMIDEENAEDAMVLDKEDHLYRDDQRND